MGICQPWLTIPEAKQCVDDPGWSRLYETVKAVEVLICFVLGIDSSEGEKYCVSRAYAGWPQFLGESALIAKETSCF